MLKVLVIIEIILIVLKILLGNYIKDCINIPDCSITNSKTIDVYVWINISTYILGTAILIMLVIKYI